MNEQYKPEAVLVEQIANNLSDDLPGLFYNRTKRWGYHMMHFECFTIETFGDLAGQISTERAFELIPIAISIVIEQTENALFTTALSLLLCLIRTTKTTEIPSVFAEKKDILHEKVKLYLEHKDIQLEWNLIREWYRL